MVLTLFFTLVFSQTTSPRDIPWEESSLLLGSLRVVGASPTLCLPGNETFHEIELYLSSNLNSQEPYFEGYLRWASEVWGLEGKGLASLSVSYPAIENVGQGRLSLSNDGEHLMGFLRETRLPTHPDCRLLEAELRFEIKARGEPADASRDQMAADYFTARGMARWDHHDGGALDDFIRALSYRADHEEALRQRVWIGLQVEDFTGVLSAIEKALAMARELGDAAKTELYRLSLAKTWSLIGQKAFGEKAYTEARKAFQAASELVPSEWEYLELAGATAHQAGESEIIRQIFRRGLDLAVKRGNLAKVHEYGGILEKQHGKPPSWAMAAELRASRLPDKPGMEEAWREWRRLQDETLKFLTEGDYQQALSWGMQALDLALNQFGEIHFYTSISQNNLASAYVDMGNHHEAESLFKAAYRTRKEILGAHHPATLGTQNSLAAVYQRTGLLSSALPLLEQSLAGCLESFGPDHKTTVFTKHNLGFVYMLQERYQDALDLLRESYAWYVAVVGENYPPTLTVMGNLAKIYDSLGNLTEAERLHEKSLKLKRSLLGEKHPETQQAMHGYGLFLERKGHSLAARDLLEQAFAQSREALGAKHPDTFKIAFSLARHYSSQGLTREVETMLDQIDLMMPPSDLKEEDHWGFHELKARAQQLRGNSREAIAGFQQILKEKAVRLGEHHLSTLYTRNYLALAHADSGLTHAAISVLETNIEAIKASLGERSNLYSDSLNSLGALLSKAGHYARSEVVYLEALDLYRSMWPDNHPGALSIKGNLAVLYDHQGRTARALQLLKECLEVENERLGNRHPATINTLHNLALLYADRGRYETAEKLMDIVVIRYQDLLGPRAPRFINALHSQAVLFAENQFREAARPLFAKVREVTAQVLGESHPQYLLATHNLARTLWECQAPHRAAALLDEGMTSARAILGDSHPQTLALGLDQARLAGELGDYGKSAALLKDQLVQRSRFLEQIMWGSAETVRWHFLAEQVPFQFSFLTFFLDHPVPGREEAILSYSIARKGLLLELAAQTRNRTFGDLNPETSALKHAWQEKKRAFGELLLAGPIMHPEPSYSALSQLQEEIDILEIKLGNHLQDSFSGRTLPSPAEIRESLAPDQILLDYWEFDDGEQARLLVNIVDPKTGLAVQDLGPFEPIQNAIRAFREAMSPTGIANEYARNLYKHLIAPLQTHLASKSTLIIVPDSSLHLVPFAALRHETGFLVKTHNILLLSSVRELLGAPKLKPGGDPCIFFAPEFGEWPEQVADPSPVGWLNSLRRQPFDPLDGTLAEGLAVANLLRDHGYTPKLFAGKKATEQTLLTVASPRILHIATHGFFPGARALVAPRQRGVFLAPTNDSLPKRGDDPFINGLALCNANRGLLGMKGPDGSDGLVTVDEALTLDLSGTELVVLSACDTGLGQSFPGQGIYGLRRAFQIAGAERILSTLWKVDDKATRAFMECFYTFYLGGHSAREALHNTQRAFLNDRRWNHPYYWAPFVLLTGPLS